MLAQISQPRPNAQEPDGLVFALLLLFLGAFLRCPAILLHGRIWAEESSIFLIGAWNRPFGVELVKPEFGYYSIWDNFFAALSSHVVPLPFAAMLFTWSAVLLLLVTGYFSYMAEFLPTRFARTLAVLVLLFTAPSVETWLNLINSEFYFGLIAAVILASDASRLRILRAFALAVAVLSGPVTTLLAPFFIVRALLTRRRGEITQAAIVVAGALLQIGVSLGTSTANRKVHLHPVTIGPVLFNKQVVLLFADRFVAKQVYLVLRDRLHFNSLSLLLCWAAAIAAALACAWLLRRSRSALLLLAVACWLAIAESSLALNGGLDHVGPGAGERYAYTPNVLLLLALLPVAFSLSPAWHRTTARVLLAFALLSGTADFALLPLRDKGVWQGEPWRQQALHWQHDPTILLRGSPASWAPFHLQPRTP